MAKFLKSRFFAPYNPDGSTRVGFAKLKAGVYIIKDKRNDEITYVGYSGSNLYKTLLRHFQSWPDKKQKRVEYNRHNYLVRIVMAPPGKVEKLELALIHKYQPIDNT